MKGLAAVAACAIMFVCLGANAFALTVNADGCLDDWNIVNWDQVGAPDPPGPQKGLQLNHGNGTSDPDAQIGSWKPNDPVDDRVDIQDYTKGWDEPGGSPEDDTLGDVASAGGGEFYDIEALYLDFTYNGASIDGINWCLVTSWNGDPKLSSSQGWNSSHDVLGNPKHFQPFIAIDVEAYGGTPGYTVKNGYTIADRKHWDLGLVLATDQNILDAGGYAQTYGQVFGTHTDWTATVYKTDDGDPTKGVTWNPAGKDAGGTGTDQPVDFNVSNPNAEVLGYTSSSDPEESTYFGYAYAGAHGSTTKYTEDYASQLQSSYGSQVSNWVWEGHVNLDTPVHVGPGMHTYRSFLGEWCGNDLGQSVHSGVPVPEPASVSLLCLALGGAAAAFRRRRATR